VTAYAVHPDGWFLLFFGADYLMVFIVFCTIFTTLSGSGA
jgi:hypothetical protein